jgi:hypothetical protein
VGLLVYSTPARLPGVRSELTTRATSALDNAITARPLWHLGKIFTKLGIGSGRERYAALVGPGQPGQPA